jgi:hypothetical protein
VVPTRLGLRYRLVSLVSWPVLTEGSHHAVHGRMSDGFRQGVGRVLAPVAEAGFDQALAE